MYIPKRYGESKIDKCPFCGAIATIKNKEKIPTCADHKDMILGEMRCSCGDYLDLKQGKFGPFFVCMNCGTMNMKKALEINAVKQVKNAKKEETVRSDDPRYFD
ncbi:MAG: hypothetical protein V1859_04305 [archaeon]